MATVPTRAALDRRLTELEARVAALEVGEPQPVTLTVTIEPAVHDDAAVGTVVATCVTDADALRLAGDDAAMVGFGDDPLQIVTTASLAGVTALDFTVIGTAAGKTAATVDVTIDVEEAPFQIPQDMDRDIDTGRFVGIGVHMQGMDRPIPEMARVRRLLPGVDAMRIGFSTAEIDADGRFTDPEIERAILEWVELGGTWLPVHAAPSNDVIPAAVMSAGPAALRTYIADVVLAEVTESWRRFAAWYGRQTPEARRGVCALEIFNEPNAYRRCADADNAAPQGAWQHLFADHQIAVARQMAEWWHGPILTALWAYNAQYEPLLIENAAGETPKGRLEAVLGRRLVWSWHFYSDWVRGVTDLEAYWAGRQGVLDFAASARMIMTETNAGDFRPEADEGQAYLWTRLLHRLLDAGVGVVWFSGFNYGSALFWGHGVTLRNPDRLATVLDAAALAAPDLTYDYSDDTTEVRRSTADPRGGTDSGVHIRIAGPGNDDFTAGDRATFYFGGRGRDTVTISPTRSTWVYGQPGRDTIRAQTGPFAVVMLGAGTDTVYLGADRVMVYGAAGADRFVLADKGAAFIDHFDVGEDRIEVPAGLAVTAAVDGDDLVLTAGGGTCRLLRRGTATLQQVAPDYVEPPVEPGTGLENPSVGFNFGGVSYWQTAHPFLNLVKAGSRWIAHSLPYEWSPMPDAVVNERLDARGYLTAMPAGADRVSMIVLQDQLADPKMGGRFVARWAGTADMEINGVAVSGNSHAFTVAPGGSIGVTLYSAGISDLSIVQERHVALHDAGEIFNPDWLELIKDLRAIRFMNWQAINGQDSEGNRIVSWDERIPVDYIRWTGYQGVPPEIMVALANRIGADPWFCTPHRADDNYVRQFATIVLDQLDPRLVARGEFSNEIWNTGSFGQARDIADEARARWPNQQWEWMQLYGGYFVRTTKIWMEVFAGQTHRLRRVLSSQTGQMDLMADAMDAPLWVAETGDHPPSYYADEFAVTSYIGYGLGSNDHAQELVDLVNSQGEAAAMDRAFALLQAEVDGLPARFNEYRQAIEQRGMKMVMYEGGSHAAPVLGWTNNATLVALLAKVARDARMGLLYTQMLDAWKAAGGQTFCLYTDVEKGTKDGSWGHLERLSDSTPRWSAVMDWNAANPGWWEARAPGTFLGRAAA